MITFALFVVGLAVAFIGGAVGMWFAYPKIKEALDKFSK